MRIQATDVYRQLESLVRIINELDENVNKMEDILMETETKIYSNVRNFQEENQISI